MTKQVADRLGIAALLTAFLILAGAIFADVPQHPHVMAEQGIPNADSSRAPAAMRAYGCGSCHTIPGVAGANGAVGPKLEGISSHSFLAGQLPNTPENLILWIQHPQQVRPGSDMPDMGVSATDARNIAAYLYSLR